MTSGYRDRDHAGDVLAAELRGYAGHPDACVLGLVRGGVPVAARVAAALRLPLDALVVRKLGVPWAPEVAFGALGPGGVRVLNEQVVRVLDARAVAKVTAREAAGLARWEKRYRAGRSRLELAGRTVIVVDDGLATGATAQAAVAVVRGLGATRVVLAVPVGSAPAVAWLRETADEVVCPLVPASFGAVSRYFDAFEQVTEDAVSALLAEAAP
ncbi:MAG TPA: phosphoribosyltransferase family protein [Rugosimonospora sp.]|nr:phosphoribosyltransferase family protein [Rugosimonospora sp.]